jgi:hypothetical protein
MQGFFYSFTSIAMFGLTRVFLFSLHVEIGISMKSSWVDDNNFDIDPQLLD